MNPLKFAFKAIRALIVPKYRFFALNRLGFLRSMPDDEFTAKAFKYSLGYDLNLENPRTFSEKIRWLNLYNRQQYCTDFADKYKAKQLVGNILGEQYVIPCYGVWDRFDDIDFDVLPDRFILKCNHDSGGYVICRDKKSFDVRAARKKLTKCLGRNFYTLFRENGHIRIFRQRFLLKSS